MSDSNFRYSQRITIRKWSGGELWLQVGYLENHPEENQVVLYKRYAAKDGPKVDKFYIKGEADWSAIRSAVESLWPELKQEVSAETIRDAVRKVSREIQLLDLVAKYPEVLSRIPADIDIFTLPADQKAALRKLLAAGGEVAAKVIKKLADQEVQDLADFVKILEELRLSTINSLVNHVQSRLSFIDAFEKAIHDDASYERRGAHSIHNLLRANIWILDRNYTVLHDDQTLKKIIQKEFSEEVKPGDSESRRPDFLCMTGRRTNGAPIDPLVLIEIKRPSVTLNMSHMTQLMEYKEVLERYSGSQVKNFKCYLISREQDRVLRSNPLSDSGFAVKTYTDFIAEARQFYEEYLEIIQGDDLLI